MRIIVSKKIKKVTEGAVVVISHLLSQYKLTHHGSLPNKVEIEPEAMIINRNPIFFWQKSWEGYMLDEYLKLTADGVLESIGNSINADSVRNYWSEIYKLVKASLSR